MFNLSPHQTIEQLFPLHSQADVLARQVNVPFRDFHRTMPHGFFDLPDLGARLGQASTEGVTEGVKDEFTGELCICGHTRAYHISRDGMCFHRIGISGGAACLCMRFIAKFRVHVVNCASGKVRSFTSGKHPFRIGIERKAQVKDFSGSLSLRKDPTGVSRFPGEHGDGWRNIGDARLPQRNRFFGSQSKIQHQDCDLTKRIVTRGQVPRFHFAIQHEVARAFTGQRSYPLIPSQSAAIGKQQSLSQGAQFSVDRGRGELIHQSEVFVALDSELVNTIQSQLGKGKVFAESLNALFVKHSRSGFLRILADVIEKRSFQEYREDRRGFALNQSDARKGKVGSEFGEPELGVFFVRAVRGSLVPLFSVLKIKIPVLSALEQSSHEVRKGNSTQEGLQ